MISKGRQLLATLFLINANFRFWQPLAAIFSAENYTWCMTALRPKAEVQDMGFCLFHCVMCVPPPVVYWHLVNGQTP